MNLIKYLSIMILLILLYGCVPVVKCGINQTLFITNDDNDTIFFPVDKICNTLIIDAGTYHNETCIRYDQWQSLPENKICYCGNLACSQ